MGSNSIPSALLFCKMSRHSLPLPKSARNSMRKTKFYNVKVLRVMSSQRASLSKRTDGTVAVACGAKGTGPREEHKALETVLKLYEGIKNKNVNELSDVIAEECCCFSNFVSAFQPCHGKKQVLDFFSRLMKNLGKNVEFEVQRTVEDGMVVGVSWKLEWRKVPLSLGKGFSFYMCHVYQGKVMIKNVEIFMEPLLHMEPLRLKVITTLMTALEKLNPQSTFRNDRRRAICAVLFILVFLAAVLFVLKYGPST